MRLKSVFISLIKKSIFYDSIIFFFAVIALNIFLICTYIVLFDKCTLILEIIVNCTIVEVLLVAILPVILT